MALLLRFGAVLCDSPETRFREAIGLIKRGKKIRFLFMEADSTRFQPLP